MSSEYSVSTTATQQQRAAASASARDKKATATVDTTVHPLSTTIITGGAEYGDKFTNVDFHFVLPWMLATTKHGCKVIAWNIEANKPITTISLLEALTFQRPHPTSSNGAWTEFYTGRFVDVCFVDESALMWRKHKASSFLPSSNGHHSGKLASGVNGVFGDCGPQFGGDESTNNSTTATKGNDVSFMVLTETVAAVIQLGTSTVQHTLFSHQVNNRQFTTMCLLPMVDCSRPLCLIGCSDGCIVAWDPNAPDGRSFSVIMTPHSSRIVSIKPIYFIPPLSSSARASAAGVEGSSSFLGGMLSIAIATEGGSVTKLQFLNRDEVQVAFQCKKVHDSVLSMCTCPANEVEKRIVHEGLSADAKDSQIREMLENLSRASSIYSLGPSYIIIQDGQTGVEIRKVKVKGLGFCSMMPTPQHIMLGTPDSKQYRLDWDLNLDTDLKCTFDLESYLKRSKEASTFSRYVPNDTAEVVAISPPGPLQLKEEERDLRVYRLIQHAARENTVFAACTNKGIFILDGIHAVEQTLFDFPIGQSSPANNMSMSFDPSSTGASTVASRFLHLDKRDGKLVSFRCAVPKGADPLHHCRSQQLMPLSLHLDAPKTLFPPTSATNDAISENTIVFEPSGGVYVVSIWPSPCNSLVAIITNTREIHLYETRRNFAPLTVPTMNRADIIAWASNSTAFASLASDSRRICIAQINRVTPAHDEAPAFQVSPSTHEVMGSNVPISISGGRWLCIHYEASFSGLSSQFFRWEAGSVGGGAIGNFIPQPKFVAWDSTATMCALAYEGTISFMTVRRKVFSQLSAVDIASPPTDIMFHNRCLFVMFQREILLLLPTSKLVQKILVASINPAVATGDLACSAGIASMYSYRVSLRPLGRLRFLSVWEGNAAQDPSSGASSFVNDSQLQGDEGDAITQGGSTTLVVVDQHNQVFTIPLSLSVAQLLLYAHQYNYTGSTKAQRKLVDSCVQASNDSNAKGGVGNTKFADAVRHFLLDCGFEDGDEKGSKSNGNSSHAISYEYIADDVEQLMMLEGDDGPAGDSHVLRLKTIEKLCAVLSKRYVGSWVTKNDVLAEAVNIVGQFARVADKRKDRSEKDRRRCDVLNDLLFEMFVRQSQ